VSEPVAVSGDSKAQDPPAPAAPGSPEPRSCAPSHGHWAATAHGTTHRTTSRTTPRTHTGGTSGGIHGGRDHGCAKLDLPPATRPMGGADWPRRSIRRRAPVRWHGPFRSGPSSLVSVLVCDRRSRLLWLLRRDFSVGFNQLEMAEAPRPTWHGLGAEALVEDGSRSSDAFPTSIALVHVAVGGQRLLLHRVATGTC
jgi:hypothetical protein